MARRACRRSSGILSGDHENKRSIREVRSFSNTFPGEDTVSEATGRPSQSEVNGSMARCGTSVWRTAQTATKENQLKTITT